MLLFIMLKQSEMAQIMFCQSSDSPSKVGVIYKKKCFQNSETAATRVAKAVVASYDVTIA